MTESLFISSITHTRKAKHQDNVIDQYEIVDMEKKDSLQAIVTDHGLAFRPN
jgi:hypothetical protein